MGNKVQEIRLSRALSQDELAELTGVAKSTLSELERGYYDSKISTCYKIINGFNSMDGYDNLTIEDIWTNHGE